MIRSAFHPAPFQLLRLQSRGRRRRILRRFCQPRRLFLSAIACVLAAVWLSNAALTIWLREPASPETLAALLSLGIVLYAAWHFARAAFFRPESPFEWTPAEYDLLAAMPLAPRDLVAYQLASVTITTLLKAGLFVLLLLPDVRCLPLAFAGLILATLSLELLRLGVDIVCWGMSRAAFLAYRVAVVAALVAGGAAGSMIMIRENAFARINPGEGVLDRVLDILLLLHASLLSYIGLPFRPLVALIAADRVTAANVSVAAGAAAVIAAIVGIVVYLYGITVISVVRREKRSFRLGPTSRASKSSSFVPSQISSGPWFRRVPHCGGAGPFLWRQLLAARRHWGSLLTALIAPAVLTCIPCFVIADPYIAFLSTTGTLAFYTFLLLPTALRFDFRRDLDRLAILKGLPVTPISAVVGQTLAPVVIATVFQSVVLAFAAAARALPSHLVLTAILIMLPLNVLVFALDNLIFLLYPYRAQQEGLEIFLRTMLTFTGKGLLFAAGLAMMAAWGFAAAGLTRTFSAWTGLALDAHAVFAAGMIASPLFAAAITLLSLARVYNRIDPVEDIPR
jgi:hypothetical protein